QAHLNLLYPLHCIIPDQPKAARNIRQPGGATPDTLMAARKDSLPQQTSGKSNQALRNSYLQHPSDKPKVAC
ncbi:MAG TPA: hypothetical protein PLB97_04620, partial [Accumulibacter sp.]|nr:hypothetical protein [Accumulibacter sp.]